ncbi:MAG TPA: hypothetical protein VK912_02915 [Longimicrobiales bacterium]|nr:hypothetical protein [Longimicrobiales bacterium]
MPPNTNNPLRFARFDSGPGRTERLLVSVFIALVCTSFYWGASSSPDYISDIEQVWHASGAMLRGMNPYSVVGPGLQFDIEFPLYYPLPTMLAFLPLATLPLELAQLVFTFASACLLAYAITVNGWHRLPIFLSGSYVGAMASVQWSPLLTAAFVLPWLGPLLLLKPNIGVAIAAASSDRRLLRWCILGGGALVLLSLVVQPSWPVGWLRLVRSAPHFTPPVLLPGGFLVLLALSRWRRPEARLLVALACVPHTTLVYEALPLMLIPKTWRESFLLATLSFLAMVLQAYLDSRVAPVDPEVMGAFQEWVTTAGMLLIALMYLPATILILRRPNEGDLPAWLMLIRRMPLKRVDPTGT